jgi:hypothetical protein
MYLNQENKSHPQKNTLLKNAQANATSSFFKRVFFSPPKEKLKNKKFSTLQKNKTSFHRTLQTLTDNDLNANCFEKSDCKLDTSTLRTDRRASGNSGFKKLAVQWLNEHSTSHQHLWWLDSFVLRNRQLLKPTNRYRQA